MEDVRRDRRDRRDRCDRWIHDSVIELPMSDRGYRYFGPKHFEASKEG